jgi:hypothetical protein
MKFSRSVCFLGAIGSLALPLRRWRQREIGLRSAGAILCGMSLPVCRVLAFVVALATWPVPSGTAEPDDLRRRIEERDVQWIRRTVSSGGASQTFAVFLSWDYSGVIFKAWCEAPGKLLIQYLADASNGAEPMAIVVGPNTDRQLAWRMETTVATGGFRPILEGRILLTAEMRAAIASSQGEIGIDAPNEMGEPWYVGSAPALKQVIAACQ